MKRKICIVTGSRADYSHLYWLMKEIQQDPSLQLQVIATGMHLAPEFGNTYQQIEKDAFVIDAKIKMDLSDDSPAGVTKSMGAALTGFADVLKRLMPDILVILGDRYEMLVAAQAAMIARIPLAHIHGGEATEGLIDESIRHSITKMAHLHFTAAAPYAKRVIQLGENPERVFNFGAPGLDYLEKLQLLTQTELEKLAGVSLTRPLFLITYHPVTLEKESPKKAFEELLNAVDRFPLSKLIFTKSNSDTEGRVINQAIESYVEKNPRRAVVFTAMGQLNYLSTLKYADVILGNSSSGIIEAPILKTPTINLGQRQRGRLRSESIIDCEEKTEAIVAATHRALSPEFKTRAEVCVSPYLYGNVSGRIREVLKRADLSGLLMKKFYDLP